MLKKIVFKNLFFYWQKVSLSIALVSFLFFLALASFLFTSKIKSLANAPLSSLKTEIILQQDNSDKDAGQIKTSGVIEPFNLKSFKREYVSEELSHFREIKDISGVLVLWQFDVQNNRTIVGLNINDPLIGLRRVEQWLMPKSKFFSANSAQEAILERHFAKLFGYKLGGQYQIGDKNYQIVGIVDFKEESNLTNAQIFMPYETALALANRKDFIVNQVYISLDNASNLSKIQRKIERSFPDFSIITKDRLLKNLSSFHRLVYSFGNYFSLGIIILAFLLVFWILKMNRIELASQTKILQTIGWPADKIRYWIFLENFFIISVSLFFSLILLLIFLVVILPRIETGPILNQNFKL